jgi:Leu/Phe-tRNA-protein transferase
MYLSLLLGQSTDHMQPTYQHKVSQIWQTVMCCVKGQEVDVTTDQCWVILNLAGLPQGLHHLWAHSREVWQQGQLTK